MMTAIMRSFFPSSIFQALSMFWNCVNSTTFCLTHWISNIFFPFILFWHPKRINFYFTKTAFSSSTKMKFQYFRMTAPNSLFFRLGVLIFGALTNILEYLIYKDIFYMDRWLSHVSPVCVFSCSFREWLCNRIVGTVSCVESDAV